MIKDDRLQFTLRLHPLLHKKVKKSAHENNRTLNSEIVECIEHSYTVQRNDYLLNAAASHIKFLEAKLQRKQRI